tara:strand:- start:4774 stop:5889 length:1116 start_codon:yes stop_codon:yes gene_type:complete
MRGPLDGIRGIELAGIGPAPLAAMLLADLGAEILRIEAPFEREPAVTIKRDKDVTLRGRKAMTLDLKSKKGREYLLELCTKADLLIEGFRPGVMERLGLGPEDVFKENPKLVYGRMTGWGQTGPMADRVGHDINYIGLGGALHPIGPVDRVPPPPLNLVGDSGGGTMFLVLGLLSAYIETQKSGVGQVVDAAIVDGTVALMAPFFGMLASGKWKNERESNMIDGSCPWYRVYETADGKYISVGAIETKFYKSLIAQLGLDTGELPDQFDESRWNEIGAAFERAFATKTRDEWAAILEQHDCCATPVLSLQEMGAHPHIQARGTVVEHDGVPQPAPAPRFSRTPGKIAHISGTAFWETEELLSRWGIVSPGW